MEEGEDEFQNVVRLGARADRISKEKVLAIGCGVFLVSTLLLPTMPKMAASAYIIAAVFGVYVGVVETVQRAMIPGYVDSNLRGTAYGVYYLVVGVAFFVANTVVGSLWESQGLWASSMYSGALAGVAILGMMVFNRGSS
jgi:MFS family permease